MCSDVCRKHLIDRGAQLVFAVGCEQIEHVVGPVRVRKSHDGACGKCCNKCEQTALSFQLKGFDLYGYCACDIGQHKNKDHRPHGSMEIDQCKGDQRDPGKVNVLPGTDMLFEY